MSASIVDPPGVLGRVLPSPTEDMNDETAALWLYELAEVYDGHDRVVVRDLAYRLRVRSEGCS